MTFRALDLCRGDTGRKSSLLAKTRTVKQRAASVSGTKYYPRERQYARKNGEVSATVVSLPARQNSEYTLRQRRRAIDEAELGRLFSAADLWRASLVEIGSSLGIVSTIAHGILGLPLNLHGDPAQVSALVDADGTPGDFRRLFPDSEASQVFVDGIGLGVGLGQMLQPKSRPIGERNIPRMRWWNPRWIRQDVNSRAWYLMTRDGECEITPGDGEWILFTPYGEIDPWTKAPWLFSTLAFVCARDAIFDRQRHSEVCSPVRVARAQKPTTPQSRKQTLAILEKMQRDNKLVLPEQYIYEVVESTGKIADIYDAIIEWAERQWAIGWTGQTVTTEGGKGFIVTGTIHERIAHANLRFFANAWFDCVRSQYLETTWAPENFGTCYAPTGGYNVDPPEDIAAKGTARGQWANGVLQLAAVADKLGIVLPTKWVIEDAQKQGVVYEAPPALDIEDEGAENDLPTPGYAERIAAKLNELQAGACRHGNPNSCVHCGIRREDEPVRAQDGSVAWAVKWVPRDPANTQAAAEAAV